MPRRIFYIAILTLLCVGTALGQNNDKFEVNGYLKYMQTLNVTGGLDSMQDDHLIHNRLNLAWYPSEAWTAKVEVRNRIFYGDMLQAYPGYKSLMDANNDYWDMSVWVIDQHAMKMLTELDRAYVQWTKNDWEVTAGRQRINWGINTVWNPNDVFNAYSFFDFDYEERPGSDAVKITRYTGFASKIEVAAKAAGSWHNFTGAGLWKINKWGYDIQLIGGYFQDNWLMGTGWAGSLGNVGFKGEASYFIPRAGALPQEKAALVATMGTDYVFDNGLYVNASLFYNSQGTTGSGLEGLTSTTSGRLNAKNLLPFQYGTFVQASYTLSPLVSTNLSGMYFPGNNSSFTGPGVTVSLTNNVTLDALGQVFMAKVGDKYQVASAYGFARVKWSF